MSENTKIQAMSFNNSKGLPKATEELDKKGGFIKWGAKNDYPFYLIDMYNGSAWHQGIIKTKTYYIAGGGLEVVSGVLDEFLKNKFTDFTIEEVVKNLAFDYELFDAFAVVGTWNRDGSAVAKWEHIDVDSIRSNADETIYYISDDWNARKQSPEKTGFREIEPYKRGVTTGQFIIYYKAPSKKSREDKGVYPKPSYIGGLTAINTDVLISQYHLYEIQNGMKGGTIVNLANGQPESQEEARAHRDAIKNSSTGVEHSNEVIVTFSDGAENAPTVVSLQGNDLADRYNMTEKAVQQNILVSHSVTTASLFGIVQEGSFNAAESAELFEVWKSTYVTSRQESLEYVLNIMAKLSGATGEVKLKEPNPFNKKEAGSNTPNGDDTEMIEANKKSEFRDADKDLQVFAEYGRKKEGYKVVRSYSVSSDFGQEEVGSLEARNFSGFFDKIGDIRASLNDLDKNILSLLKDGEDSEAISQAVDEPLNEVAKSINKLENLNLLVEGSTSELGSKVLDGLDLEIDQFEVVYSYEKRPGVQGADKIPTTRDFCATLIDRDLFYTRQEINTISARVGRDVWRFRGGFYHNPDIGRTTPWCRHEWQQHLVIKS